MTSGADSGDSRLDDRLLEKGLALYEGNSGPSKRQFTMDFEPILGRRVRDESTESATYHQTRQLRPCSLWRFFEGSHMSTGGNDLKGKWDGKPVWGEILPGEMGTARMETRRSFRKP
jgi:hypothetical protein